MEPYLTTKEAAKILGVLPRQVTRLIGAGKIKASKIGRDWIINEKDLNDYLDRRRSPGRPRRKEQRKHENS